MTKETGKWLDDAGPRTRAIRSGIRRTSEGEHVEPIFTSPIRPSGLLRSDCVQRDAAGISEGLVRIAVGLEDLEDLQSDCLRGAEALTR